MSVNAIITLICLLGPLLMVIVLTRGAQRVRRERQGELPSDIKPYLTAPGHKQPRLIEFFVDLRQIPLPVVVTSPIGTHVYGLAHDTLEFLTNVTPGRHLVIQSHPPDDSYLLAVTCDATQESKQCA